MFTVLICSNAFLEKLQNEHSHLLDIISNNQNCAICPWREDVTALRSLDNALPTLEQLTCGRTEWRAVLMLDSDTLGFDYIDKRNPFDVVDACKALTDFNETEIFTDMKQYFDLEQLLGELVSEQSDDEEKINNITKQLEELKNDIEQKITESGNAIRKFRKAKEEKYRTALTKPITQLAIWMSGPPIDRAPEASRSWPEEMLSPDHEINWDYYKTLYSLNYFPSEFERYHTDCIKYEIIKDNSMLSATLSKRPKQIIALSERYALRADDVYREVALPHEALEYDHFCDDNMYPSSMRYILCDVPYENGHRTAFGFLSLTSLMFMLALNDIPYGALREGRVYNGTVQIDKARARHFFTQYFLKLNATKRLLSKKLRNLQSRVPDNATLTPEEAVELFESDANVPVKIRINANREEYKDDAKIGLAKDCPKDEYDHWYSFVTEATRKFIRYLREPRRAVKNASKNEFRQQSVIEDERIFLLDEDRLEDIQYRLQEEEFNMIKTTTTRLFESKLYLNRIDHADKAVRNGIARRMTKKRVLISASAALGAFLFSFIPLLLHNNKDAKSFTATVLVTGISLGILALAGLIFLFVVRRKQKKRIALFNATMDQSFDEIENGLQAFSKYLRHACNVMRAFSIFNFIRRPRERKQDVVKKHLCDVQMKIDGINGLFINMAEADENTDVLPYNYDFSKLDDYVYEVPYEVIDTSVRFITRDNVVSVPIDYIIAVDLTMEELYD